MADWAAVLVGPRHRRGSARPAGVHVYNTAPGSLTHRKLSEPVAARLPILKPSLVLVVKGQHEAAQCNRRAAPWQEHRQRTFLPIHPRDRRDRARSPLRSGRRNRRPDGSRDLGALPRTRSTTATRPRLRRRRPPPRATCPYSARARLRRPTARRPGLHVLPRPAHRRDTTPTPSIMSLTRAGLAANALGTGYALPSAQKGPSVESVLASMSPQTREYTKRIMNLTFAQLGAGAAGSP